MKQRKLIKEVYKACIEHNLEKLVELRIEEFRKILKRKAEGKAFTSPKWAIVRL
jgi:hypothetical protein